QELRQLRGQRGGARFVAFSLDGKKLAVGNAHRQLATGTWSEVGLWDLASGKELWQATCEPLLASSAAFSPDGAALVVAGEEGPIRVLDATSGRELRQLEPGGSVTSPPAFSPDGRTLAVAVQLPPRPDEAAENAVLVWEWVSGSVRRRFTGHEGPVSALAF